MDKEIRKEFYDGVHEVYSIMFTDGKEDGIKLYLLSSADGGIYKESKVKKYKAPVLIVAKATMSQQREDGTPETVHDHPTFRATLKSLNENGIESDSESDWETLRKAYIEFHGAFYEIQEVKPTIYVEDAFMAVDLVCEQRKDVKSLLVEEEPEEPEEDGESDG